MSYNHLVKLVIGLAIIFSVCALPAHVRAEELPTTDTGHLRSH